MKKQLFSLLLAVCLVVGIRPTTVFAAGTDTGKAIQIGAPQIEGGQADSVYFGNYQQSSDGSGSYNADPIKWRVLSNTDGKLFLLADQNLDVKPYNTSQTSITWEKSTIRSWLNGYGANENEYGTDYNSDNFIDTAFSGGEQGAIAQTDVYNATQSDGNDTTDKIFLLSIEEANNSDYFPNGDSSRVSINNAYVASRNTSMSGEGAEDYWRLRSTRLDGWAAIVQDDGVVFENGRAVNDDWYAVRPAFNLDLNSVLFTSAAVGGKSSGSVGAGSLQSVSDYSGNEWKLTLLDTSRSFSADADGQTSVSAPAGGSVQITYSGAQTGNNEYVSVLLCDSSDNVLYYGNIAQNSESGTASVTIPADLGLGSYSLKVFSEQYNGGYQTDYASAFQEIALEVVSPQYTVTFATDYGTAPASITVTAGTAITLPELEDDGDYALVGWWILDDPSVFSDFGFYSAGEEYEVSRNVTFYAEWHEIITLTAPFTTTVKLGDYGVPGETVFTLEVVLVNVAEEGSEDMYKDVTVSASVTTDGKGDYDGTMTFTGPYGQLRDMLTQGVYVQQVDDGKENWTYDDTIWYLILAGEPEIATLTSTYDTMPGYEIKIFQAICEETEYGPVYGLDWENMDWDSPEAKMLFTNTYTAHDYTLEHNETEHWDECGCGDVQNREAHRYGEWTVTKEATEKESGEKERTCTVCGYTQTAEIEKLPASETNPDTSTGTDNSDTNTQSPETGNNTDTNAQSPQTSNNTNANAQSPQTDNNTDTNVQSPQTGDNSNIVLWFFLMLVAGAALAGTVVYTHKKKHSR